MDFGRLGQRPSPKGGTYVMGYVDEEGVMHAPGGGRPDQGRGCGPDAAAADGQQRRPSCTDLRHPLHA